MDNEPRIDAKLKNLPKDALEDLWRFRNPEEGGKKLSFEEILVEIPLRYGVTSSLGALSEFYAWLKLKRRMESAAERAEQVRIELAKDNTINAEDVERVAQMVFTSESLEAGNVKAFVALAKLRIAQKQVAQDERRIAMLEANEQRRVAAEEAIKAIQSDGSLTAEQQRAAVLNKFDEFFGLKK